MLKSTQDILDELYKIDPSLKSEKNLKSLIVFLEHHNPQVVPSKRFKDALKKKLITIWEFKQIQPKTKLNLKTIIRPLSLLAIWVFALFQFQNFLNFKSMDQIDVRTLWWQDMQEFSIENDELLTDENWGEYDEIISDEELLLKAKNVFEENEKKQERLDRLNEERLKEEALKQEALNSQIEDKKNEDIEKQEQSEEPSDEQEIILSNITTETVEKNIDWEPTESIGSPESSEVTEWDIENNIWVISEDITEDSWTQESVTETEENIGWSSEWWVELDTLPVWTSSFTTSDESSSSSWSGIESSVSDTFVDDSIWADEDTSVSDLNETPITQSETVPEVPVPSVSTSSLYYNCDWEKLSYLDENDMKRVIKMYCSKKWGEYDIENSVCMLNPKKWVWIDYIERDLCQ